jgi:hypothetical protein
LVSWLISILGAATALPAAAGAAGFAWAERELADSQSVTHLPFPPVWDAKAAKRPEITGYFRIPLY